MLSSSIRVFSTLLILTLLVSCHSQNGLSKEEYEKRKAQHAAWLKLIRIGMDPYYNHVPDSMKKWIHVFAGVMADDQQYRMIGLSMTKEESKRQKELDVANLSIVTHYLDRYGWPATRSAGLFPRRAIGMVIQHAPLSVQEKYYPQLVEAFRKDTSLFETLALLEDRINMRKHRLQYYGTQVISFEGKPTLYPVMNVDSMDEYRKQLGRFISFSQYMSLMHISWDPVRYKEQLPLLVSKLKVTDSASLHYVPGNKRIFSF